jgi:sec-independent protein translocase protein TatC
VSQQDQQKPADPAEVPAADGESASNGVGADGDELEDKRMSLLEHLQELRVRLRNAAIAFILAMVLSFVFVKKFFEVLVTPTAQGIMAAGQKVVKFQATTPTEGFWVMMKLAVLGGLIVAAPLVFWELWKFVAPGLYKKEKRMALGLTMSTAICFAGGAMFGYFVLSKPAAYFLTKMLTDFAPSGGIYEIAPEYRIGEVTDFLILTLAGCGAAFELPVVLVTLGAVGIVSARSLWKFNKYALILSAVAGAVLTPSTDVFTQVLLAGPLYFLYNISILLVWLIERGRRKRDAEIEATYTQ